MTGSPTPALELLVAGYLNQDWPSEYPDVWAAVDDFVRGEPGQAGVLRQEVAGLLESDLDEEGLRHRLVDELHGGYWPPGDGYAFRSWLTELAARLV